MEFSIGDDELREMARIESESGCDVEAGFDWGTRAGAYLSKAPSYIDREKLLVLLQESLSAVLDQDEIDAIASEVHNHTKRLVMATLHPNSHDALHPPTASTTADRLP